MQKHSCPKKRYRKTHTCLGFSRQISFWHLFYGLGENRAKTLNEVPVFFSDLPREASPDAESLPSSWLLRFLASRFLEVFLGEILPPIPILGIQSTTLCGPGAPVDREPVLEVHPPREEFYFPSVKVQFDVSDVTSSPEFVKSAWRIYSMHKATVHVRGWRQSTTERKGLTLVFYNESSSSWAKMVRKVPFS